MRASLALVLSLSAALTHGQTVITVTKTFTRTISSAPADSCSAAPTTTAPTTTVQPTTTAPTSTGPIVTPTHPPVNAAPLALVGVNIAGFDFGCGVDGTCSIDPTKGAYPPLPQYGGPNGIGQMAFFEGKDGFNAFRLPVGWQYLNQGVLGQLDATAFGKYDELVQACLGIGAYCIIDIHNYARYNGSVIGQGGIDASEFAILWAGLATHYANQPKVIFGLMNEPHDIPNIYAWAGALQGAVGAIRSNGATSNYILLPGTDWASAQYFVANSADALTRITNLDGTTTNLIFDVHKYSDSDNSGTHAECTTDNIASAFSPLADWLRTNNRQALLSEFGGGNTQSCVNYVCAQTTFIQQNSDVYLGYIGWAAGSFGTDYVLSEVPNLATGEDTALVGACFVPAQAPVGLPSGPGQPTGPTTTDEPTPTTTEAPTPTTTYTPPAATQTEWGQCGGIGWSGPTSCPAGIPCKCYSDYYCQCTRY